MRDYKNYHETDLNRKILHDGNLILEKALDGFEAYDAILNDEKKTKILLLNKFNMSKEFKTIIGRPEDIKRGNLFKIDNDYWLVVTYPENNKIYKKADAQLCNGTFTVKTESTFDFLRDENGELKYDRFGNPIPIEIKGEEKEIPCVYENKYMTTNDNQQLPLPDGRIHVTLPYVKADNININKEFYMEGIKYKISDIDYSKKIGNVGIMTIIADRVVKENGDV